MSRKIGVAAVSVCHQLCCFLLFLNNNSSLLLLSAPPSPYFVQLGPFRDVNKYLRKSTDDNNDGWNDNYDVDLGNIDANDDTNEKKYKYGDFLEEEKPF